MRIARLGCKLQDSFSRKNVFRYAIFVRHFTVSLQPNEVNVLKSKQRMLVHRTVFIARKVGISCMHYDEFPPLLHEYTKLFSSK